MNCYWFACNFLSGIPTDLVKKKGNYPQGGNAWGTG